MKTFLVQLEPHDDLLSIRDKITWSKARRTLLIWPRRGRLKLRQVDYLLLARHAQASGTQIGLVARDPRVLLRATLAGVPVFTGSTEAQRSAWKSRSILRTVKRPEGHPPRGGAELRRAAQALRPGRALPWPARWAVFLIGITAVLALGAMFVPSAQVSVTPERKTQQVEVTFWANPKATTATLAGNLPAASRSVTVEGQARRDATGQAQVGDRTARGTLTFKNLTDQPVVLPAGTTAALTSSPAVRFVTQEEVELEGWVGAEGSSPAAALAAGSAANVEAGQVTAVEGSAGLLVSVTNLEAMTGGSDRMTRAPSSADYRQLRKDLQQDLLEEARQKLAESVGAGMVVIEPSVRIARTLEEEFTPAETGPADVLTLHMKIEVEALVYSEAELNDISRRILDAALESDWQPEPAALTAATPQGEPEGSMEAGYRWTALVERPVKMSLHTQALAQQLAGQPVERASSILLAAGARQSSWRIFPDWLERMPWLAFRIEVREP